MDTRPPINFEEKIYQLWQKGGFFNPDKLKNAKKKVFSIAIPPPNVTGFLHMGHALNATIQDIIIRRKRMQGFKTLWVPGIDHASIATQNVVEKKLRKENLTRFDLGREKFIEKAWEWKREYGDIILNQLKKIGVSCDWSRVKFTMDDDYIKAVYFAFSHYFNKGWIYRDKRAINWCSRCKTSLSDLELEYEEEKSKLIFIKYPLADEKEKYIEVATTRPETMLGDTAVAVNPKDKRYKDLIGKNVFLPLAKREIPIITDRSVDLNFGTGAIKVTPAHSLVDYQISLTHKLKIIQVIDENGRMSENAPKEFQGLKTEEAREKVLENLQKLGLISKIEEYANKIPKCERCHTKIEIIPSEQWFLKMDELAKMAMEAVADDKIHPVKSRKAGISPKAKLFNRVNFHPKRWEKIYLDWLKNVHDWCISRQLWWGQRMPVWFCENEKKKFFISAEKPKKCAICGKCKPKQSTDVFDTWFSAALWPFAIFGWPKETKDLKKFFPTNVLTTARDIINLWVSRMVFSSREMTGKNPFADVIIYATVLTKDGKRMSKSLGTGIDPLELIEKYGADAMRLGLAWQITDSQDIRFDESNIIAGRKFCTKVWNATRFILQGFGNKKISLKAKPKPITSNDKKIMKKLGELIKSTNIDMEKFAFGRAIERIYHFFWHEFCDIYIEKSKKQIQEGKNKKENTEKILFYVLLNSLKLLHPFIPFITEEIYQLLPLKEKKSLIVESWPE
ncbi:MAG: valine--tRNA ligase [bacterium]|nr:valine--tRNA ligase [bacterium]